MNITSRSRYALKIMMDFARVPVGDLVKRQDITRRQGVPAKYLDQIMVLLRRGGLIESVRGREGGYYLTRSIGKISVWDILEAVESGLVPVLCLEEEQSCAYEASCVTANPWRVIFDNIKAPLARLTLGDLCRDFADERKMCPVGGIRECPSKSSHAAASLREGS